MNTYIHTIYGISQPQILIILLRRINLVEISHITFDLEMHFREELKVGLSYKIGSSSLWTVILICK